MHFWAPPEEEKIPQMDLSPHSTCTFWSNLITNNALIFAPDRNLQSDCNLSMPVSRVGPLNQNIAKPLHRCVDPTQHARGSTRGGVSGGCTGGGRGEQSAGAALCG